VLIVIRLNQDLQILFLLFLFHKIVKSGKHLAIMAHFNHPKELSTKAVKDVKVDGDKVSVDIVLGFPAEGYKAKLEAELKDELAEKEPDLRFHLNGAKMPEQCFDGESSARLIDAVSVIPHGVLAMSGVMDNLVETSNNLSSIRVQPDCVHIHASHRSSAESALNWGIYWVNDHIPDNEMGKWLENRNAVWVNHLWFDEIMLHVYDEFKLTGPDPKRFHKLIDTYNDT